MENKPGLKKSSWWRRRTSLEKVLIIVLLIISVATAVAVVMVTVTLSGFFSGVALEEASTGNGHLATETGDAMGPPSLPIGTSLGANNSLMRNQYASELTISARRLKKSSSDEEELLNRQERLAENEADRKRDSKTVGKESGNRQHQRIRRWAPNVCSRCRHKDERQQRKQKSPAFRPPPAERAFTRDSKHERTDNVTRSTTSEYCLSANCVTTAAKILESIDQSINPCDDFFEYACGTWKRVNPIPDDRPTYSTFRKIDDQLQFLLKELLEAPLKPNDIVAIRHAKTLYQSCLNTSILDERQGRPLEEMLQSLGGWPVVEGDNWSSENFDLTVLLVKVRLNFSSALIHHIVNTDEKDSRVNIIQLDQAILGMQSKEYFLKGREDKTLMAYQSLAVNVAQTLGADPDVAAHDIRDMVDFEIQLANITIPEEHKRDVGAMYHRYRIKDLYGNFTKRLDWVKFFTIAFSAANISIDEEEEIVVASPVYMKDLGYLIEKTSNRTLANYIIWLLVMNRIKFLSQKFNDLQRDYNKAMTGADQERARWRFCVIHVNDILGMAVGRLYIEKHFDEAAKARVLIMIRNIKDSLKESLQEVPWMEEDTKRFAQEKAEAMDEQIGYPADIMNDTALNLDYVGIKTDPEKYFENIVNILQVSVANNHKQLRLPADRDKWVSPLAVVNAFYNSQKNQIVFAAGIFHPPFYNEHYPMSLNFGGIGMVIGHEITHGFDDRGRQFDKNGNLKQWWSDSDVVHFKEKAQCIVDQYSNFTVQEVGMNINGRQTQGENIADNGGLKQAFRAYKKWAKNHPTEPRLPGLNLTHDQLFFINFAQVWCGALRPESLVHMLRASKHCPGRFRVTGSVSNSRDFAKAFNCPLGSKMNPVEKCSIW